MPPRTRSQAARNRSPATAPGSGRSSRYATPTAFDALAVEGASSSESEPESEHEKQHSSPTSAARYGASHLTPAPVRRGGRKASASSEPESATESLKPTNSTAPTDPSLAAAPDAEDVERPQTEDVRRQQEPPLGAADAAASVSGDKNGRIWTSTNYDDQDPNHVHAEAEAVAQAGNHSDPDPESSATASASASSTVNGHTNSKAGETTKSQTAVHARAHASVDTPGEEEKPGKDAERTKVVSTKTEKEVSPAPQPPRVEIPEGEAQVKAKKQADRKAWWTKVYERTVFTFFMIGGFIFLLLLGHPYMILLVMLLATLVYREIVGLFNLAEPAVSGDESPEARAELQQHRKDSLWSKTLSWYFFVVANYFLYGESLVYYFKHIIYEEVYFVRFAKNHRFLSLMLYVFGFMAFILQLRRDNLKRQFGLFSWVHMTLFLIVVSSHFMVNSILEGMIWFWVPASLIICNDIFAYVCGMLFGRTPLISLSPKKTREGFFGAFVITVVFSYFWGSLFQRYNYMVCNFLAGLRV